MRRDISYDGERSLRALSIDEGGELKHFAPAKERPTSTAVKMIKLGGKSKVSIDDAENNQFLHVTPTKLLFLNKYSVGAYRVRLLKPVSPIQHTVTLKIYEGGQNWLNIQPALIKWTQENCHIPQKIRISIKDKGVNEDQYPDEITLLQELSYPNIVLSIKVFFPKPIGTRIMSFGFQGFTRVKVLKESPQSKAASKKANAGLKMDEISCSQKDIKWSGVAYGKQHCLMCSTEGQVYSWGQGLCGQLGLFLYQIYNQKVYNPKDPKSYYFSTDSELPVTYNFESNSPYPKSPRPLKEGEIYPLVRHPLPLKYPKERVSMVACGDYHSLFLTAQGAVWACGAHHNGRLGLGKITKNPSRPMHLELLAQYFFIKIGAGGRYSMGLTDSGSIYSWGEGAEGCLGQINMRDAWEPNKITTFTKRITDMNSGSEHCGCIDEEGHLWMWGSGNKGKLGTNQEKMERTPKLIDPGLFENESIIFLSFGDNHSLFLTQSLQVYSCGLNSHGQLGLSLSEYSNFTYPQKLKYFTGKGISTLTAGKNHSGALSLTGLLYMWGCNSAGQLGSKVRYGGTKCGLPMLIPELIGFGVSNVVSRGNRTLTALLPCNVDTKSRVFIDWKNKLIEHEISYMRNIDMIYKNEKRNKKLKEGPADPKAETRHIPKRIKRSPKQTRSSKGIIQISDYESIQIGDNVSYYETNIPGQPKNVVTIANDKLTRGYYNLGKEEIIRTEDIMEKYSYEENPFIYANTLNVRQFLKERESPAEASGFVDSQSLPLFSGYTEGDMYPLAKMPNPFIIQPQEEFSRPGHKFRSKKFRRHITQ